jgi:hypothetical protein
MDEDDERVWPHVAQTGANRLPARRTSGDAGDDLGHRQLLAQENRGLLPPRRSGDDDRVDPRTAVEPVEALGQQRAPGESRERLRTVETEAFARPGGDEDSPDISAFDGNV